MKKRISNVVSAVLLLVGMGMVVSSCKDSDDVNTTDVIIQEKVKDVKDYVGIMHYDTYRYVWCIKVEEPEDVTYEFFRQNLDEQYRKEGLRVRFSGSVYSWHYNPNYLNDMAVTLLHGRDILYFSEVEVLGQEEGQTVEAEGFRACLQLLDDDGVCKRAFKEGENINFKLTITNERADSAFVSAPEDQFDDYAFNVYSTDGTDMGKPWDAKLITWRATGDLLRYGASDVYNCSWLGTPDYEDSERIANSSDSKVVFLKQESRQPLPVGDYYTQFTIPINSNVVEFKLPFSVQ